jgi:type I restriction enzyme, S subunit
MSKWRMLPFDEVFIDETHNATKIKVENYFDIGKYPIIDQGQKFIGGYTNDDDGIYENVPAIIFGDHTRILKYINVPFFLGADGTKLLKSKLEDVNYKFLYYYLLYSKIPNTGYNRHFKWLKQLTFFIPPLEIQKEIADLLDTASFLMGLRKLQLEKLDLLLKSKFIEMFGDPVKNPYKWNVMSVGKVIKSITAGRSVNGEARELKKGEQAVLKVSSVTQGFFKPTEYKVITSNNRVGKWIFPQKGDLLFSRANTREMVGATCLVFNDYPNLCLPDKIWRIRFNNSTNMFYMKYILSSRAIRQELSKQATGTSGSMYNISMEKLKEIRIPVPSINLQNQFADFVQQVEQEKMLLKQSLETLELNYKALMQKCFDGML